MIRNAAYTILSVFGMIVIFNLYNIPLGEKWHGLRFLLYPHISAWDMPELLVAQAAETAMTGTGSIMKNIEGIGSGFASILSIQFPVQISSWYFVFLLMGVAIILYTVKKIYGKARELDDIICLSAVLALGHLVYFINRPCFDYLSIAFFEAVLIMSILADEMPDMVSTAESSGLDLIKRAYQYLFIAILSVLSVLSVWQAGYRISDRDLLGYYAQEEFDVLLNEIKETVPEDAIGIGMGIQEIYAQLGWDTRCYIVDMTALGGNDHAVAQLMMSASTQRDYLVSVREIKDGEKNPIETYMSYWGVQPEALTIKEHWDMGIDSGNYWDIYYLEIDQAWEHMSSDRYRVIYQRDQNYKWK